MNTKVSLIIAVYKDIQALDLIIKSLKYQTYKNFEVIIAEDGNSNIMRDYLSTITNLDVIHTTQEDKGVRKSKSQNNAIKASTGEYLIMIDGDCILYHDFIERHLLLSDKRGIVTGRRVNLGPKYSQLLREEKISSLWLEKNFIFKYFDIQNDAKTEKHSEEGFKIAVNGLIHKLILYFRKKESPLLGCNMSFYKKAMIAINGFDEGLGNSAMASDTDLTWRFKGLGYHIISAKFIANEFHLYHTRNIDDYDRSLDRKMLNNQNLQQFHCLNGLE